MQTSLIKRSSPTGPGNGTSHGNFHVSMNHWVYNSHATHHYSPGRVYRPKSIASGKEKSEPMLQPTASETPDALLMQPWPVYRSPKSIPSGKEMSEPMRRPTSSETPDAVLMQWPPWLENLLSMVRYNFPKGLVFFCVSCNRGLYQEKHFEEGANHHGHDRLRMYEYEGCICVNWADIESLGVNTAELQDFTWSTPEAGSALFIFMHNTFGYAYEGRSRVPWENCANCCTRLQYVRVWTKAKFCCLDCKVEFMNRVELSQYDPLSPKLVSPQRTPSPAYESHLPDWMYAPMIAQGNGSRSPLKTDNGYNKAAIDVSSQLTNIGDKHEQFMNDVEAAFQGYLDSLPRDQTEPAPWMSQQYGLETDSEDEITSFRRSHSDCKVERASKAEVTAPGTPPADEMDTMVSTYREATLTERGSSSKNERIIPVEGHSQGLDYGDFGGFGDPEQRCRARSDSWDESGAIVDEYLLSHDPIAVAQSPNAREVDQMGLPEVLYEDQLHVLLSPCEEIFSSMHITTPPGSPASFPEDLFSAKLNSECVDSKPLESPDPVQVECSVPTPSSFHTALAAASCSSNCSWRRHTTAVTKSARDVEKEGMKNVEELGLSLETGDSNILRKAASLLLSLGSEFEKNYHIRDEEETNSIQASSSPGALGPEFSMTSPEVVSYKIQGTIDFKSLKQLAATFDPQRWISEARCPKVMASKLPVSPPPVL